MWNNNRKQLLHYQTTPIVMILQAQQSAKDSNPMLSCLAGVLHIQFYSWTNSTTAIGLLAAGTEIESSLTNTGSTVLDS
jgi:hypothetical protein